MNFIKSWTINPSKQSSKLKKIKNYRNSEVILCFINFYCSKIHDHDGWLNTLICSSRVSIQFLSLANFKHMQMNSRIQYHPLVVYDDLKFNYPRKIQFFFSICAVYNAKSEKEQPSKDKINFPLFLRSNEPSKRSTFVIIVIIKH